jgi:methylglutaconyl-CoA hydratase
MTHQHLKVEIRGGVASVALNRPEVRNAFNEKLITDLTSAFTELATDETLRAAVLRGEGKVFCAGADAEWMAKSVAYTPEQNREDAMRMAQMFRAISEAPFPVVGRIQRAALGGGAGLAAACDVVVAAEDTKFGFTEVRLGIIPAVISSFVLPKIGVSNARRYFLTGENFGAAEARAMGLVHEICPEGELDARVDTVLGEIKKSGPRAVREAKRLIREVMAIPDLDGKLKFCAQTIARVRASEEGQEGLRAFLEKREPGWMGETEK